MSSRALFDKGRGSPVVWDPGLPNKICRTVAQKPSKRLIHHQRCILDPAAKFTRHGRIKVSARTFDAGKRVAVMVQDTGMGIPKGKLAAIFLPFEQVRPARESVCTPCWLCTAHYQLTALFMSFE
jgi:hypothetical protein